MKYLIFVLIAVQLVLVVGCSGAISQSVTTETPVQTTAAITTEAQPVPLQTTNPTSLKTVTTRPPLSNLKPTPSKSGTKPVTQVTTTTASAAPSATPLEIQKVLHLGMMIHLEGWNDTEVEDRFNDHAELVREYATLYEKYGAKLTLESKETTDGALKWGDNFLLEMEERGHGLGVHADVGGNKAETTRTMELKLKEMKSNLESLDVTVRHVSGICARADWVTAAINSGFGFTTGTVAFALASLSPANQIISVPEAASPAQFHEAYPFNMAGRLHSWRAENGSNWINDDPKGDLVIIPSGGGLAYSYEESQGQSGLSGDQVFTAEDITAFEQQLQDILAHIQSDQSTQPYTYYLSWSFGKALDQDLMEEWLQMVDKYVRAGQVEWQTIPEMYDEYLQWEIDSGRRN